METQYGNKIHLLYAAGCRGKIEEITKRQMSKCKQVYYSSYSRKNIQRRGEKSCLTKTDILTKL